MHLYLLQQKAYFTSQ